MVTPTHHPQTAAESLISVTIQATWILYAIGGLYIAGPLLGWTLAFMAAARLYLAPGLPPASRPAPLGSIVHAWLWAMLAMLLVLVVGHVLNDLGAAKTIKSAIGWAKGWALLGLFPFAAAVLEVRSEVMIRAICRLGRQTLFLLPLFVLAPRIGLPGDLYTSPLKVLGGSGDEFFKVLLYTIEPGVGAARWQFFAPWSPAAGMVAVVHMLCAAEEKDIRWKITGIVAGIAVALLSQSRLALVAIALIWPMAQVAARLGRPSTWWLAAPGVLLAGLFGPALQAMAARAASDFSGARADSSRVRATLGRIAVERWQHEAPWFGHGIVENGPHIVEYMPIGSHHSWYGLLFVKGGLGAAALGVALGLSLVIGMRIAMQLQSGRVAFSMLLVLLFYSFGENLEVLAYLFWPALVLIGIAAREYSRLQTGQSPDRRHFRTTSVPACQPHLGGA